MNKKLKSKQIAYKRCTSSALHSLHGSALHSKSWEINARSRDLNTRPLLATSLNPFYNICYFIWQKYTQIMQV